MGSQTLRGRDVVERHGVVTTAIIDCYDVLHKHEDTKESTRQATWLLIDEINRADIDRAFGSLFTALSGGRDRRYLLDYLTPPQTIVIPARFRIIAALNSFDTRFVNTMSAALRRRFARVIVLPPDNENGMMPSAEFDVALTKVRAVAIDAAMSITMDEAVAGIEGSRDEFRRVFGLLRGSDTRPGLMIGTAQAIDCLAYMLVRTVISAAPLDLDGFLRLLDESIVARLSSSLESDHTRSVLETNFLVEFEREFPTLTRTARRLTAFLNGTE